MRATLVLSALILAAPALAKEPAATSPDQQARCQSMAPSLARESDKRLMPQKLTQLPPANGYMAVYRKIGGCDAPLTLSDYRRSNRR